MELGIKNIKNSLISIFEGGMGNKFGCLFYAIQLSKETGKELVINTVKNNGGDISFYDLFSKKNNYKEYLNTFTELDEVMSADVPFLIHKGHFNFDRQIISHRSLPHKEIINHINSYDVCGYLDDASSHAPELWEHSQGNEESNESMVIQTAKELIIKEDILEKVTTFCSNNNINKDVAGVHIRATDWPWKDQTIKDSYETIQNLTNDNPDIKIFVCCDEKEVEDDLISQLPNNIITFEKNSYVKKFQEGDWRAKTKDVDGRVFDYNVLRDKESVIEAFIDMLILSRTDIKYGHWASSFNYFAKVYSNVDILK